MPPCARFFILIASFCLFQNQSAEIPTPRENWKMELIAEAPKIKHPSVVACAPDGKVFVAEDPMDITRPAHVSEGRILCIHPDGRVTVFAEKLHAVFGMQYLEGKLYVLHNPRFSVFRDENGVGQDRAEVIEQTNPNPWALDWNDHVPANFRLGMDGRFYIAVGDKGIFGAVGRDGKRVDLHGGGILRVRPDGTDLEIYSTGVRNILDVAMTDEDEIFTYDNTDENQWMGRATHMVDGGFYGYPFDFIPQRPYTLWMMADYGAGAATGTAANIDDALPPEYRNNLFLADFGQRNIRRVQIQRDGATFKPLRDEQLFINPPADFRPVGITFSSDGSSIYICDWQHRDTKEQATTGRLWKLTWTGKSHASPRPRWYPQAASGNQTQAADEELVAALAHSARAVRMAAQRQLIARGARILNPLSPLLGPDTPPTAAMHAIWIADQIDGGKSARPAILQLAQGRDPRIARQAIRQLGNARAVEAVSILTNLLSNIDASIRFQAATALGRIGDWRAVEALVRAGAETDFFARYAAFHAVNRIAQSSPDAWPAVIRGLKDGNSRIREASAFAMRETFDKELVRMLAAALRYAETGEVEFKAAVLNALAPLHHKPPVWNGEWWAYHPFRLSPPAKTNDWEGTSVVFESLTSALDDSHMEVRLAAAGGLEQFGNERAGDVLFAKLNAETDSMVSDAIFHALVSLKYAKASGMAIAAIRKGDLREGFIALAKADGGRDAIEALNNAIRARMEGSDRAIGALLELNATNSTPTLVAALNDARPETQRAAIQALGAFKAREAIPKLVGAALRTDAMLALARMPDARATDLFIEGLGKSETRAASRAALSTIRDEAWPRIEPKLKLLPKTTIAELQRIYHGYAVAEKAGLNAIEVDRFPRDVYLEFVEKNHGDAERGEKIFKNQNSVACINCHRVRGEGVDIGPDLSGIGAQFDRRALAESVLFPSRAVREGYNVVELDLNDDERVSGMIRAESNEAITLQPAAGPTQAIPKAKIKSRKATPVSLMPESLESGLSFEEFSDLISFLQTLRSGT